MSGSLFSSSWYRVAALKPRLRSHTDIQRHYYRGQAWYVLQDHSSRRFHRFTPAAFLLINLMDGKRSVEHIWQLAADQLGDDSPTQDEMIQILSQLHAADVLQCDISPDSEELFRRHQRKKKQQWKQMFSNPLSIRLPLFDPEKMLRRWLPVVKPVFSGWGLLVWSIMLLVAILVAAENWSSLTDNVIDRVLSADNLLILWLTYPIVKALHELGHAFATKVWGGEVHELGIMLLVLVPIPYVDASASSAFRDKRQRIIVSAAGMMVETTLAALALFVWVSVEDGLVSSIAYNIMLIGGISTVLFNGNPLLRFDGYYMLADAVEIPNLGGRSRQHLIYLFQRYLFGMDSAQSPAHTQGERNWFIAYGILSFLYRIVIMITIILYIATQFLVIGILLAIWAALTQAVIPLFKLVGFLLFSPTIARARARAITTSGTLVAGLTAIALFLPVPLGSKAQGIISLPEQAYIHTATDCFITDILAEHNTIVSENAPLLKCDDPFLRLNAKVLEAKRDELHASLQNAMVTDRVKTEIIKEELSSVEAELALANERLQQRIIQSPIAGTFVLPEADDLLGRYIKQGVLIAYVIDPDSLTIQTVIGQDTIALVRQNTQAVEARLAGHIMQPIMTTIKRQIPGALDELPSKALGSEGGGAIAVDPTDNRGLRPLTKTFQVDLEFNAMSSLAYMGKRVYVRFNHGNEPLARRWYRAFRQLFLRQFNV